MRRSDMTRVKVEERGKIGEDERRERGVRHTRKF